MILLLLASLACVPNAKESSGDTPSLTEDTVQTDTATPCEAFKAYADADGDGYGDVSTKTDVCTLTEGLVTNHTDCDDADPEIHPGAPERCNDLDDNCNAVIDENPSAAWYYDGDGDGYGDPATPVAQCSTLSGYVADGTDCDDTNANVHPGAEEHCDLFGPAVDENCDGDPEADAGNMWSWYPDADGDGSSTASEDIAPILACPDQHPTGTNADHADCDDADPAIHPGAEEICDGIDQDCDGDVDDHATDATHWFGDIDGDGYGDPYGYFIPPIVSCDSPGSSYVDNGDDCYDYPGDPFSGTVHPGAEEVCDEWDNDCDGYTDDDPEGVSGASTWYWDMDGDGWGGTTVIATDVCELTLHLAGIWNGSITNTDCDDTNPNENPGVDNDADGFSACDECDDRDWHVNPDATEVANGYDDDCDGEIDEE